MKRIIPFAVALVIGSFAATPAQSGDDNAIATYRDAVMDSLGKHMKATGLIVKGKVDRQDDLVGHAVSMHEMSLLLGEIFPEGSGADTRALPAIWENPTEFQAAVKSFQEETSKLVLVARTGTFEEFGTQFQAVGGSCGGCHDSYRAEEEE